MKQNFSSSSRLFSLLLLTTAYHLNAVVDDISGDTGGARTGSLTLSGGTSGGVYNSTTSTITHSFNFLSLPLTSATDGQIIMSGAPVLHNYGQQNLFVGGAAGNFTTTGFSNTGCGPSVLIAVTSGSSNTAVGDGSLGVMTEGIGNVVCGAFAGSSLIDGSNNILVGVNAGISYNGSETNNVIIGAGNSGVTGESNTIRIGTGGTQVDCYIDGIYASTIEPLSALPTFVDDQGKVGTIVSSAQFKDNVKDIGNDSKPIFKLRPVSFYLKSDLKKVKQFGLIAEEVYKIFPELVVLDKHHKPFAVRYHELPVLLLNELQKKSDLIDKLQNKVEDLMKRVEKLEKNH